MHAHHPGLIISRGNESQAAMNFIAVYRLSHFHLAQTVEPVSIHLGKAHRHMPHDYHTQGIGWEPFHHFQSGFGAAGRSAQADDHIVQHMGRKAAAGHPEERPPQKTERVGGAFPGGFGTGSHQNLAIKRAKEGRMLTFRCRALRTKSTAPTARASNTRRFNEETRITGMG